MTQEQETDAILKKLTAAGYVIDCRERQSKRVRYTQRYRAIARDNAGLIVSFASAADVLSAMTKLADMLGLK